mmetsp:Transcript_25730/g.35948  ORF Transcript_25730/g.35948 Transcript_25730/m.35948 type:complete len:130 (-) Transcript_25730:340-729(-)|eukprot:CAMPEP_0185254276 /NCGR_PEP_ID=MMETSP1359-20130426/2999_1 /TAXON_ID=552665 /ORGANISM="Bigelowiella longifila, Strain CCMP242" /LENGTH=129 /DNA_ID=CAMNT_0027837103 /DNA_START=51 /DNA_END=440 /DNA_ORIENTATION=-
MCKFCNQFREMDYMGHMEGGFGFGGMGRYHDPDGFDFDPGEDMMTNGLGTDSTKFEEMNKETKALPQAKSEKKKAKKIRRRPSSRLAKYGLKRKGEKASNNSTSLSQSISGLASPKKGTKSDQIGSINS